MSRAYSYFGIALVGLFGVLIPYATLRPELEAQKAERLGEFKERHQTNDTAISDAILSDFKEARQQIEQSEGGGFAWGIRKAIWGGTGPREKSEAVGSSTTSPGSKDDVKKGG